MDINVYIRPDPNLFYKETEMVLEKVKEMMAELATETNVEKRKTLSEKIQEHLSLLRDMAIFQEEKTGTEKIEIFMKVAITRTPHEQGTKKIALSNAQKLLESLLSDIMHDVKYRKRFITELERELRTAKLQQEFVAEIMKEVYQKLRHLSKMMENVVVGHDHVDFFRAEIALDYLSLIPDTTEEELKTLSNKLLAASPHYQDLVKNYTSMVEGSKPIKKGDVLLGIYDEEPFIAKVIKRVLDEITCKVSFARSQTLELRFDLLTKKSLDWKGLIWGNIASMKLIGPRDAKPDPSRLAEYSRKVLVIWKSKNREEKIGIGYYNFGANKWTITEKGTFNATCIPDSSVISWFYVPEGMKNNLS